MPMQSFTQRTLVVEDSRSGGPPVESRVLHDMLLPLSSAGRSQMLRQVSYVRSLSNEAKLAAAEAELRALRHYEASILVPQVRAAEGLLAELHRQRRTSDSSTVTAGGSPVPRLSTYGRSTEVEAGPVTVALPSRRRVRLHFSRPEDHTSSQLLAPGLHNLTRGGASHPDLDGPHPRHRSPLPVERTIGDVPDGDDTPLSATILTCVPPPSPDIHRSPPLGLSGSVDAYEESGGRGGGREGSGSVPRSSGSRKSVSFDDRRLETVVIIPARADRLDGSGRRSGLWARSLRTSVGFMAGDSDDEDDALPVGSFITQKARHDHNHPDEEAAAPPPPPYLSVSDRSLEPPEALSSGPTTPRSHLETFDLDSPVAPSPPHQPTLIEQGSDGYTEPSGSCPVGETECPCPVVLLSPRNESPPSPNVCPPSVTSPPAPHLDGPTDTTSAAVTSPLHPQNGPPEHEHSPPLFGPCILSPTIATPRSDIALPASTPACAPDTGGISTPQTDGPTATPIAAMMPLLLLGPSDMGVSPSVAGRSPDATHVTPTAVCARPLATAAVPMTCVASPAVISALPRAVGRRGLPLGLLQAIAASTTGRRPHAKEAPTTTLTTTHSTNHSSTPHSAEITPSDSATSSPALEEALSAPDGMVGSAGVSSLALLAMTPPVRVGPLRPLHHANPTGTARQEGTYNDRHQPDVKGDAPERHRRRLLPQKGPRSGPPADGTIPKVTCLL